MIKSFADKDTEKVWKKERCKRLPRHVVMKAWRQLQILNQAKTVEDLRNSFGEKNFERFLKADLKGQSSIRTNDQWRICFFWEEGNAHSVKLTKHYE